MKLALFPSRPIVVVATLLFLVSISFAQPPNASDLPDSAMLRFGNYGIAHGERIAKIAFIDDQTIAVADTRYRVKLWNIRTGRIRSTLPDLGGVFALSSDRKQIAFGKYDGLYFASVAGLESRKQGVKRIDTLNGLRTRARPTCVALSPDQKSIATCSEMGAVRIWNVQTGQHDELATNCFGRSLAFSPDGKMLVAGGGDYRHSSPIKLWNVESGELLLQQATAQSAGPFGVASSAVASGLEFSADGESVLVSTSKSVWIWNVTTNARTVLANSSARAAFSPDGKQILVGGRPQILSSSGKPILKLGSEETKLSGPCAYSPDGRHVAMGHEDGRVSVFDAVTGNELIQRRGHTGGVRSVVASPAGVFASISRDDASVRVWGKATGGELKKLDVSWDGSDVWWNEEGSDLFCVNSGRTLASWASGGRVWLWNIGDFKKREVRFKKQPESPGRYNNRFKATLFSIADSGSVCAFSGYEVSNDGIRVFEMDEQRQIAHLMPFDNRDSDAWVGSLAFNPEGTQLAVGCLVGSHNSDTNLSVQIWDIPKQQKRLSIRAATSPPGRMCISPDGKLLATAASGTSPMQIWRLADGSEVARFEMQGDYHGRDPTPLAFSHDSQLIAAANSENKLSVWEVATKKLLKSFKGHIKPMTSVAFSHDRESVVTGSEDGTMLAWRIARKDATAGADDLTEEQLDEYWNALGSSDPQIAKQAIDILSALPVISTQLCDRRLTPAMAKPKEELAKRIADLGNPSPKVHLPALVRLQEYGEEATAALFSALAESKDRLSRQRIETALERVGKFPISSSDLQRSRAIQLLEIVGTEPARKVVKNFVDKSTDAGLVEQARSVAQRMYRHTKP